MGRHDEQHLYKVHYISTIGLPGDELYFADSETSTLIQHMAKHPNSKIIRVERAD